MMRVTLVAGPPCAGKNTYVDDHRQPGDAILDYDALAVALGGTMHQRLPGHHKLVIGAYYGVLHATGEVADDVHLWAISGAPTAEQRQRFRDMNGADVVVLTTPADTCIERARQRFGDGDRFAEYVAAISRWWDDYEPDPDRPDQRPQRRGRHRYAPCLRPGCGELVLGGGYCSRHAEPAWAHDAVNGSRHERGYGSRWVKRRAVKLAHDPNCAVCGAPAVTVDHIVPKTAGGSDDWANLQSLCDLHHRRKSGREGALARQAAAATKSQT